MIGVPWAQHKADRLNSWQALGLLQRHPPGVTCATAMCLTSQETVRPGASLTLPCGPFRRKLLVAKDLTRTPRTLESTFCSSQQA